MHLSAAISSKQDHHEITVSTNGAARPVQVPVKSTGFGSSVNGGELLLLALATCFCNDIYREAAKRSITVTGVEVECTAEFGAEGEAGKNFSYTATVHADVSQEVIDDLIRHTDQVAEIHNTLRAGSSIVLRH